jgi:transposase-like protein
LRVSDVHIGLQVASRKCFLGASWQQRTVHFMWNRAATIPWKDKLKFAVPVKQIWLAADQKSLMEAVKNCLKKLKNGVFTMDFQKRIANFY